MKVKTRLLSIFMCFLIFNLSGCSSDSNDGEQVENPDSVEEPKEEEPKEEEPIEEEPKDCSGSVPLIIEKDGVIRVDAEAGIYNTTEWELRTDKENTLGDGYLFWSGKSSFSQPGKGVITYKIKIETPGTYRIELRHVIAFGSNTSEYNDIWLRLPDADDFFGKKSANPGPEAEHEMVYPRGGQTPAGPFPKGNNKEGWFKVFAKSFNWTWKSVTGDNQGYEVFATFNTAKTYTLELSGRSMGYGIDQFVLYQQGKNPKTDNTFLSEKTCE